LGRRVGTDSNSGERTNDKSILQKQARSRLFCGFISSNVSSQTVHSQSWSPSVDDPRIELLKTYWDGVTSITAKHRGDGLLAKLRVSEDSKEGDSAGRRCQDVYAQLYPSQQQRQHRQQAADRNANAATSHEIVTAPTPGQTISTKPITAATPPVVGRE
jgi:hypothetical protein